MEDHPLSASSIYPPIHFSSTPKLILNASRDFQSKPPSSINCTKGLKWSPDGLCLISASDDHSVRLFELPHTPHTSAAQEWTSLLKISSTTIYDYCWYAQMQSSAPASCFFLTTSKGQHIKAWDAFNGMPRCSYASFDHVDEPMAPHSIAFNISGDKIYAGFDGLVRIFDTSVPGKTSTAIPLCTASARKLSGQNPASILNPFRLRRPSSSSSNGSGPGRPEDAAEQMSGICSTIAFNPDWSGLYAVGSFSRGVALLAENSPRIIMTLSDKSVRSAGGVTQVQFSRDGNCLFVGSRRAPEGSGIACWDIRNTRTILFECERDSSTNQKIGFDFNASGEILFSGSRNGTCLAYAARDGKRIGSFESSAGCVNGVSVHPWMPYVALSTGERRPSGEAEASSDSSSSSEDDEPDSSQLSSNVSSIQVYDILEQK